MAISSAAMIPRKQFKVVLVNSNTMTNPYPVFPLGIAFLEAALYQAGHHPQVWDPMVHAPHALESALDQADVVGVSLRNVDNVSSKTPQSFIEEYHDLLERIRSATTAPIIAGGSAFSIFPMEMFEDLGLDWGIQGEAEAALVAWLEELGGTGRFDRVPGLLWRENGSVRQNPTKAISGGEIPAIRPCLDWVKGYLQQGGVINVQTQRGCALHCTYCTYPWIEGKCYRHRDPDQLVAEIRHLQKAGGRYVFLTDSVFNMGEEHVRAVCTSFIRAKLGIEWGCFARPHQLRPETLDLMIEAGMKHLEFGSDSFCDATLKSYGKSFRFADILEASRIAATRAVHTCHYIIFGGPGETADTIRQTVENSRQLPDFPIFAFSGMRIYPHTPLYKQSGTRMSARELLLPSFYEDPVLPAAERARVIAEATAGLPNWILSDHADDTSQLTEALRRRGKQGPLWEYLGLARRMEHG